MTEDTDFTDVMRYYLRRVIGLNVPLADGARPAFVYEREKEMRLPMTYDTLAEFFGQDFVERASEELIFSILLGLAYHESAHALSGERHDTMPHILNNLICDANDLSFVPKRFPGAIPFTLMLFDATMKSCEDVAKMAMNTSMDKLVGILSIAITYLRHLKFPCDGKFLRDLPDGHALKEKFDLLVPVLRQARKAEVKERPELVRQFHEIIKDWWDDSVEMQNLIILKSLSGGDAGKMEKSAGGAGALASARRELMQIREIIENEDYHYHEQKPDEPVKVTEMAAKAPRVDESLVVSLRKNLRQMLETRAIARSAPSVRGSGFAPERFHEIRTRPRNPRVRKEVMHIGHKIPESLVCLCFDRSGSMEGEKERLAIETAATLYCALAGIPQVRVIVLTFDDQVYLVKDERFARMDIVLRKLPKALTAQNGTNLPKAMRIAVEMMKKVLTHRKVLFILTDGDTRGDEPVERVMRDAERNGIRVVCIGIPESRREQLEREFGASRVAYIEDVQELIREMASIVQRHI